MGWDGMGWDRMGWDGMGWDGMGWDGIGYRNYFCHLHVLPDVRGDCKKQNTLINADHRISAQIYSVCKRK